MKNAALASRLDAYSATLRSSGVNETRRRRSANWQIYAAATGSVLAMATSASAGVITNSTNVSVSIDSATHRFITFDSKILAIDNSTGKKVASFHLSASGMSLSSGARAAQAVGMFFFIQNNNDVLGIFGNEPGGVIDQSKGAISSGHVPAGNLEDDPGLIFRLGFAPGVPGYAGFAFDYNGHTDYGWIKLVVGDGQNGLPDSLTATETAFYDANLGNAPEPSTGALAILAAGFGGVAALRRRKHLG